MKSASRFDGRGDRLPLSDCSPDASLGINASCRFGLRQKHVVHSCSALNVHVWSRQSRTGTGHSASLERPVLRPAALRCSVLRPRRGTHCVRCALSVRTSTPRVMTSRAAREAASPVLLSAPEARCSLSPRDFAERGLALGLSPALHTKAIDSRQSVPGAGDLWGAEEHSPGVGARSALRKHSRRGCPNAANAVRVVSSATRPQGAHRRAVGRSTDRPSVSLRRAPTAATRAIISRGQLPALTREATQTCTFAHQPLRVPPNEASR